MTFLLPTGGGGESGDVKRDDTSAVEHVWLLSEV